MVIIRNAIRCHECGHECGEEIESFFTRDHKTCSCGTCSVDGGHAYLRRCCKSADSFTDISVCEADPVENE
ncbi:MAG: hypothetical protein IJ299_00875 [Oscillospiraceae bacterium]|nr:hypothetical protein [Oscillospiraceae bacterium]